MIDKLIFFLSIPFFIPHYLIFKLNSASYLKEDLVRWRDVFAVEGRNEIIVFFRLIILFKEYRSVFYYRLGGISKLLQSN